MIMALAIMKAIVIVMVIIDQAMAVVAIDQVMAIELVIMAIAMVEVMISWNLSILSQLKS